MHLRVAREHPVALFGQTDAERMRQINQFQPELARFEVRFDLFDEMEVGLFRVGVVGVAGHRDVAPG